MDNFGTSKTLYSRHISSADGAKAARMVFVVMGGIFLFIGIIFLGICMISRSHIRGMENRCTAETQATVVRVKESDEGGSYSPVVEFTTDDGRQVTAQNNIYSSEFVDLFEGDEVEIHYDPDSPRKNYYIGEGLRSFNLIYYIFGGVGGLFALIGVIMPIVGGNAGRKKNVDELEAYYNN